MTLYPIHADLQGKRCVVVGAGAVAERKVAALRECGALIRLVAPQATPPLQWLAEEGALTWMRNMYHAAHLDGAFLVIAATDLREVNEAVARDAQGRNILVCRADEPAGGNFLSPASVTRGDLVLTVSTSGLSPTLAAVLRRRLEDEFGPEWGPLTALMGCLREGIQAAGDEAARRAAVRRVIDDPIVREGLRGGNFAEAEARARECLSWSSE
ncbi:MAG: bifunctional precorrin-2 dehydrogenase/sirohydrochlorin ferrochelatase [Armatimonadetes bacterium]|nr:bifunctional precorrin-2 dehydrogenase/sirohydrochlorin ferrochelatase [Armatimonadota bacterium]